MVFTDPLGKAFDKCCQVGIVCENQGSVWIVKDKQSNKRYIAKIYELEKCNQFSRIQNENALVRRLQHVNIIKYIASFVVESQLWTIMPLIGYTSASRLVHSHFSDGLPEPALSLITKDVLNGLSYLHLKGIIHRSIKGSHILVDSVGRSILSGFRHSIDTVNRGQREKYMHSYPEEAAFNINWASPEMLKQDTEGYCEKTDIYSLGITLCELGNGEVPYCKFEPQIILVEKVYGREPFLYDSNSCKLMYDSGVGESYSEYLSGFPRANEKNFSAHAHQFVAECLVFEQQERPSALKLLEHPFVRQGKKMIVTLPQMLHPVTPIREDTNLGENSSAEPKSQVTNSDIHDVSWNLD